MLARLREMAQPELDAFPLAGRTALLRFSGSCVWQAGVTEREIRNDQGYLPSNIVQVVPAGRRVVAIKLLRESTGLGLASATAIVDKAAQQFSLGGAVFEPSQRKRPRAGCSSCHSR